MWEMIKEGLVEGIRRGLPALGAVTGAFYGTKKGNRKIQYTGAAMGWMIGWVAQKGILWALSGVLPVSKTAGLRLPVAPRPQTQYNYRMMR